MSRTKKDIRRSGRMYIGIGQKMKQAAKEKRNQSQSFKIKKCE